MRIRNANKESGELEIPVLSLQQSTLASLRNLVALEQCCPGVETHLTAYAIFMDKIIDTPQDVEILKKKGIIESKLGTDEDVADLFNNICKQSALNYDEQYLKDLFEEVNIYCDSDQHRWKAELANKYFLNPWARISILGAVALLVLTLVSTGATIWQSAKK